MTSRHLTHEQQTIIDVNEGSFLVIAPPGSGKTTIVTERVLRFASSDDAFRILALTYTNKAARNIEQRLNEAQRSDLSRVTAQTMHAFCHDILRNYGHLIEVPDFTIYDDEKDRIAVLREGLEQERLPVSTDDAHLRELLVSIGRLKRDLVDPAHAPQTIEKAGVRLDAAYEAYDNMLRRYAALDFDDLLLLAHRVVSTRAYVADLYRTIYRYVMVDEAQDTSLAQYEIVRAIFGEPGHRNVMLVADADQSIFQFAGANVEHLRRFEQEFRAKRCGLTQNFRCSGSIVAAANALISRNEDRLTSGGVMTSSVLAPGLVTASSYATASAEAKAAVEQIAKYIEHGLPREALYQDEDSSVAPEHICILGRARYLLDEVRRELEQRSIGYQFSAGREAGTFESKEFASLISAMRWRANPTDGVARRTFARSLQLQADQWTTAQSLFDLEDSFPAELGRVLRPLRFMTNVAAVDAFIAGIGDLAENVPDPSASAAVASDLERLRGQWSKMRDSVGDDALARLESELALAGSAKLDGAGIRVLTIHAAKGLEFRAVTIVGMNEGGFPHYRSSSADAIIEERRSAYVAFTRAERVLSLMRFRSQTTRYGTLKIQRESRFIEEAGIRMDDR